MNKNFVIGLLLAVLVIGGGYYLITSNQSIPADQNTNALTPTPVPTTSPTDTVPPLTLGTPTVTTNSNFTASSSIVLVNGQVTPNGLSTTYWFEYGKTNALGGRTASQEIGSGFYPISAPSYITGLLANTTYYFRLMANNNLGTVYGDTYTFTTNANPPPKVALPTVRTNNASNLSNSTTNINGQVTPNGWQTNYWFEYGVDNKLGNITSIKSISADSASIALSTTLTGLKPLTKYYFRLNAQNQFGTVNGSTLSFTTKK